MQGILSTTDYETFTILDEVTDKELVTFIGAKNASKALPGDLVKFLPETNSIEILSRSPQPPIVGVLELASKTKYGMTSRNIPIYLFIPYSKAYPPFIVGSSEKDTTQNYVAVIEFASWDHQFPRGNLKKLIGPCGSVVAEEEALLLQYAPIPTLKEPGELLKDDAPSRDTLNPTITFNIDPVGCKDVDDVISVVLPPDAAQDATITITISDVAAHIQEMSALDVVAATIGQTFYKDGMAIRPMLPLALSEDSLSLLPGKERLGLSLSFSWNETDGKKDFRWHETRLVNQKTYTYEEAEASTEEHIMLFAKAVGGSNSHEWIEEAMKLYNLEAAKLLVGAGVGILRAHSAPDFERLEKYVGWDKRLAALASSAASYVEYLGSGSSEAIKHFGLGAEQYCHATSPIRRYADLMNQRLLKQIIRKNTENLVVSVSLHDLNKRSKAAKAYERDLCFMRALLGSGTATATKATGRILDISIIGDGEIKIRTWIENWKKTIQSIYKGTLLGDGGKWLIKSRDEKNELIIAEGDLVEIEYAANLRARRWKERLVVNLVSSSGSGSGSGCSAEATN